MLFINGVACCKGEPSSGDFFLAFVKSSQGASHQHFSLSAATPIKLIMVAISEPQPLITSEWKFDPAITFVTYRTYWQKAETVAKQRLVLLQKATRIDDSKFLHLLDDLIAFANMHKAQGELWESSHPVSGIRSEPQKARELFDGLLVRITSSPALGKILENLKGEGLDDPSRRFLEHSKQKAHRSGAFLSKEERKQFRAVSDQVEALRDQFLENIEVDMKAFQCPRKDRPDNVEGRDKDVVKVVNPENDKIAERACKATYSLAPQNEQVIQRMVELRYRRARLLGYANFVKFALGPDTLVNVKTIRDDLAKASVRTVPLAESEMAALSEVMKSKGKELKAWNVQTATGLLLTQRFSDFHKVAAERVLSYEAIVNGLLQLIGEVFSLNLCRVVGAKAWHPSVQVYEVFDIPHDDSSEAGYPIDTGRRLVGRIYLDLIDRPEKDQEAHTFPVFPGLRGSGLLPAVCIGGPFVRSATACFDFASVGSLLHKIGHCIHFLLAQQSQYNCFSTFDDGTATGDILAQLLKELLRQEAVVRRVMNEDEDALKTLQPLLAEREIGTGMFLRKQILYSIIYVSLPSRSLPLLMPL